MTLRAFPMLNDLSDSLFADRFNRIDRLFRQYAVALHAFLQYPAGG